MCTTKSQPLIITNNNLPKLQISSENEPPSNPFPYYIITVKSTRNHNHQSPLTKSPNNPVLRRTSSFNCKIYLHSVKDYSHTPRGPPQLAMTPIRARPHTALKLCPARRKTRKPDASAEKKASCYHRLTR